MNMVPTFLASLIGHVNAILDSVGALVSGLL